MRLPYSLYLYFRVFSLSLDLCNTNQRQTIARLCRLLLMYGACRFKPLREQGASRREREEKRVTFHGGREGLLDLVPPFSPTPRWQTEIRADVAIRGDRLFRLLDFVHARSRFLRYAFRTFCGSPYRCTWNIRRSVQGTLRTILHAASAGSKRHGRDEKSRASYGIQGTWYRIRCNGTPTDVPHFASYPEFVRSIACSACLVPSLVYAIYSLG